MNHFLAHLTIGCLILLSCAPRVRLHAPDARVDDVTDAISLFQREQLALSGRSPASVTREELSTRAGEITATARLIDVERAAWNQWPDGTARLFNDRAAIVFAVQISGDDLLGWEPRGTRVEVNRVGQALRPAVAADDALGELLYWALQEARWGLTSDLAARARAAGPFRAQYLPLAQQGPQLDGLVVFPRATPDGTERWVDPVDVHVDVLRLTIALRTSAGPRTVSWTFD